MPNQRSADRLESAVAACRQLMQQHPNHPTLTSIEAQLQYLLELANGASSDRSRLHQIVIGVQAAREIESMNLEIAEQFHEAASIARTL